MGVRVRERPKGSGIYWIFIDHQGKRKAKKVGRDKRLANEAAKKIEAKLILGHFDLSPDENQTPPTFGEYAKNWISLTVPVTCKESTLRDYHDILKNHVLPVFGNYNITDVTRGMVKDFLLGKRKQGYAANTVCHFRDVISGVFNKAIDDEVLQTNPALRMGKYLRSKKDRREALAPLNSEELSVLLRTVRTHYKEHFPLFLLLARTGLRIGEALALKWEDIDFNGRFMEVKRGLVRGKIQTPKNGKNRRVDMSLQLTQVLNQHLVESKKKGLALGLGALPEYIFTNSNGGLIDKDNWRRRVFAKALQKAGLRKVRIHDLRHTYATLRISKGDNIADVSNQLGHHSVKLTLDTYYHWMPGGKKSEIDALDDPSILQPSATYPQPEQKNGVTLNA